MDPARRSPRYSYLTDAALQEQLVLTMLAWLRAHGHGNDAAAAVERERGRELVSEHYRRGLDPDTGRKINPLRIAR